MARVQSPAWEQILQAMWCGQKKKKKNFLWEFPGGPVVRTGCFHPGGLGSVPGWGTQMLVGPKYRFPFSGPRASLPPSHLSSTHLISPEWNVPHQGLNWTGRPGVLRFMGSQRVGHD